VTSLRNRSREFGQLLKKMITEVKKMHVSGDEYDYDDDTQRPSWEVLNDNAASFISDIASRLASEAISEFIAKFFIEYPWSRTVE
jgi:hypothetical protein